MTLSLISLLSLPKEIQLVILNYSNVTSIITRLVCKKWSLWIKSPEIYEKRFAIRTHAHYGLNMTKWFYFLGYPIDVYILHIAINNNNLNLVKWLYSINPNIDDPFMSYYYAEIHNKEKIKEYLWSICTFFST